MKAVFMGTPEHAVPCLEATCAWAGGELAVVTQPDRPRGRSGRPEPPPVKARALELGLAVLQPERLRGDAETLAWLREAAPEVIVVVAFGQILPPDVLAVPRLGCVNVHFSLLPKYRGAAPVQWAILRGETETGIATMLMDEGLDSGDVLLTERVEIGAEETAGELLDRLAARAPGLLRRTLEELAAGRLTGVPQDPEAATWAPRLTREDGQIDWRRPASELVRRVRGVTPWPGALAEVEGEPLKLWRVRLGEGEGQPGQILEISNEKGILVAAGEGAIWLEEVQAPGRSRVRGGEYARGRRLTA